MKKDTDRARILIEDNENRIARRLVNIQSIYKNGSIYEYKITLEGFAGKNWSHIKNSKLHSVDGNFGYESKTDLKGSGMEISYHVDGNTAYKDVGGQGNMRPMVPNIPLRKINEPRVFFRIAGFRIDQLEIMTKSLRDDIDSVLSHKYANTSFLTCDFHLGKTIDKNTRYALDVGANSPFLNSEFFDFDDEKEGLSLILHFYESNVKDGPYFSVIRNDWIGILRQKLNYLVYKINKKIGN